MKRAAIFPIVLVLLITVAVTLAAPQNPVELGNVSWHRDYKTAQDLAARTDRDIFLFFQEVPG
jgi:hypothetical protein